MSEIENSMCTINADCGIGTASPQISRFSHNCSSIKFIVKKDLSDCTVIIVTDSGGVVSAVTEGEALTKSYDSQKKETTLIWQLQSEITFQSGCVVYQIVACRGENEYIWYSKEGRLIVNDSIDTTDMSTALIGSSPNLVMQILDLYRATKENVSDHSSDTENPHSVTKSQLGLENVDNTSDINKPISNAARNALNTKVDKIAGKGLSTYDFTYAYIKKIADNKEEIENTNSRIDTMATDLTNVISASARLNTRTTDIELRLENSDINISEIGQGLGVAEENILASQTEIENIKTEIQRIDTDISVIDDNITESSERIVSIEEGLGTKVDKAEGKGLSTEDYTTEEKEKLSGLSNYDDTAIREDIEQSEFKQNQLITDVKYSFEKDLEPKLTKTWIKLNYDPGTVVDITPRESTSGGNGCIILTNLFKGDKFYITTAGGSQGRPWAWFTSDNVLISVSSKYTAYQQTLECPEDNCTLVCNFDFIYAESHPKYTPVLKRIDNTSIQKLRDELSDFGDDVESKLDAKVDKTSVTTDIRAADSATDDVIPTELAVANGIYDVLSQLEHHENSNIENRLIQAKKSFPPSASSCLSILHFADIHGDTARLKNIVDFYNENRDYVDDIICAGDFMKSNGYTTFNWFTGVDGSEEILLAIGNHDRWNGTLGDYAYQGMSETECYDKFFAPGISNWGIVDNGTHTYYYKDYADYSIRLIVLDTLLNEEDEITAQNTWLETVLSDALENSYSVVICEHYNPANYKLIDCNFTSLRVSGFSENEFNVTYQETVQNFMDGGGKFICYLAGHMHRDYIGYNSDYPHQLFIMAGTASLASGNSTGCDTARVEGTLSENLFNVISFDTTKNIIKINRIGANRDCILRDKNTIVINYTDKSILSQN